jgi:hypothetical protein
MALPFCQSDREKRARRETNAHDVGRIHRCPGLERRQRPSRLVARAISRIVSRTDEHSGPLDAGYRPRDTSPKTQFLGNEMQNRCRLIFSQDARGRVPRRRTLPASTSPFMHQETELQLNYCRFSSFFWGFAQLKPRLIALTS